MKASVHTTSFITRTLICLVAVFLAVFQFADAQPWTYDFGTGTGTFNTNNSNSTTFLNGISSTPSGGGTYRVRTSNGQGGDFVVANAGTSLGTASELQIKASATASSGKFGVYSWTSPASVAYLKAKIRTTSSSNGNLAIVMGASTLASGNNGYTGEYNVSIANFVITYSSGSISAVNRRISGSTTAITGSGFAKGSDQEIEIYANNGSTSASYTRGGTSYTITTQQWDLWVDGTKISPANGWPDAGTWAVNTAIGGFCFYGESSTGNVGYIYLDDLEYSNSLPTDPSIAISGVDPGASSVSVGTSDVILQQYNLAVTTANASLTGLDITTAGSYVSGDITNLKVRYSADATLDGGDATLSTLTTPGAAGLKSFPSFTSQTINSGNSGYIFITADVAGGATSANTINIASNAFANFTFASGSKTGTDPVPAASSKTFTNLTSSVAISNNSPATANQNAGTNNVVLQRIDLAVTVVDATLSGLTVSTAGTYDAADLVNLKVRYSADATLDGGDATLSTKTTSLGTGSHVFPSFTSQDITSSSTGYLFITADIASSATGGNTIQLASTSFTNIDISGTKTGTDPVAAANVQTIVNPSIAISSNSPAASVHVQGSTNVVLNRFDLAVTSSNATLTGITVNTSGTYISADVTNLKVRYSTDATLDGGDATLSTFTTPGVAGSKAFPSFSSQVINSGSTGYIFITADISSSATSGNTISLASTAFSNLSFSLGNKTGTDPVAAGNARTLIKDEPSNYPTIFACGSTTTTTIPLSWTDATGSILPEGYLIKWSATSYGAISDPVDGTAETNGAGIQNVTSSPYTVTGLTSGTTYFFKIWSFTNSGSNINYKLTAEPQTSCGTQTGPCLEESFDAASSPPLDWTYSSVTHNTNNPRTGARSAVFNGDADAIVSPLIAAPLSVSFWWKRSGTSPGSPTFTVSVGPSDTGPWTQVGSTITSFTTTYQQFTEDISSYSNIYIQVLHNRTSGTNEVYLDDFEVFCGSSCTAPTTTASVSASNITTGGVDLGWTGTDGDGTLIAIRATANSIAAPVSGTSYTPDVNFVSAGQININNRVVFRSAGSSVTDIIGLTAETQYTATAYNYNNTDDCYQITSPASTSFYTLSNEPTSHSASFSATAVAYNQINLSFNAASSISNADGYLVIRKVGSAPTGTPTDGIEYTVAGSIGDGTVAEIVNSTSATSISITGLSATTNYYFTLIPFNWNGTNGATYNYYTAATIPSANATTLVQPSNNSDILADGSYGSSNISYSTYQNGTASSTGVSVGVFKFTIRDGAGSADADMLPTILEGLTIHATNIGNIRAAALFGGPTQNSHLADGSVGSDIVFTNLAMIGTHVTAGDGGTKDLTLRVTFNNTVTDNQQTQYTITHANTVPAGGSTSSLFAAFANQNSNTAGDVNRIEVTATTIAYGTQPTEASVNVNLAPFTILAVDALGNQDLDENSCTVAITKGVGVVGNLTVTGSPFTFSSGLITVSTAQFDLIENGVTLVGTAQSCLGSTAITSNTFNIEGIVYVANDYQSATGSGLLWGTASHWRKHDGSNWGAYGADGIPSAIRRVYIQGAMSTNGSRTANEIIVLSGGNLTVSASSTATSKTWVKDGGTLTLNNVLTNSGVFEVENNGTVIINYSATNNSSLWSGTEIFHEASNFIIRDWDANAGTTAHRPVFNGSNITTNTYSGYEAAFGNLDIDISANLSNTMVLISSGVTKNLAHGNMNIKSTSASQTVGMISNGTVTSGIGGTLTVDDLYAPAEAFQFNSSGVLTFTIKGNLQLDGATTRVMAAGNVGSTSSLTVEGNIIVTASANLDLSTGNSANPIVNIYLKGDISVVGSGNIYAGSTLGTGNFILNFSGTGDGSTSALTQEIDIASTSATFENKNVMFRVNSGAYVRLINRNMELGTNAEMRVDGGGTLDFGFNGTTPLIIGISGSQTGTTFRSESGSILKITSTDGISTTGSVGNVQVVASNRTFIQTSTFWYVGVANQVTGNGITNGSGIKTVIADLASNTYTLSLTNSIQIASGGQLEIRKGIVIETPTTTISGTGRLVMSDGVFRSSLLSTTLPQLSNYGTYSLTGGTIELNGNGSQSLSGAPSTYFNLAITNTGTKTITGAIVVSNNVNISNGTFDLGTNGMTGSAGLTMTSGLLRISKSSGTTFPEINGISTPYALTGGTIELYGTTSVGTSQLLRGTYGSSQTVTYFNVELNATSAKTSTFNINAQASFALAGTLNVNSPTVFQLDYDDVVTGTGSFIVNAGATLKYAHVDGITTTACGTGGSCGNIRTSTRTFTDGSSYGWVGNQAGMITGNGVPANIQNLYVDRAGENVTLSQNVSVSGAVSFSGTGFLLTIANKVVLGSTATISETDNAHVLGQVETTRLLTLANHSFGGLGLEIDANGAQPGSTVVTRYTGTPISGAGNQGIKRKFRIEPTTNAGLNAKLIFTYFDSDMNGLDENTFELYRSTDNGVTWVRQTSSIPDPLGNLVSKTGIDAFSEWTLSDNSTPLPVSLIGFYGKAGMEKADLFWSTASEKENGGFKILRSTNGISFEEIGFLKGRNSGNRTQQYKMTDFGFNQSYFYKLVQIDQEGTVEMEKVIFLNCGCDSDLKISVFPNPAENRIQFQANLPVDQTEIFTMTLIALDGRIICTATGNLKMMETTVNQKLEILSNGLYQIRLSNDRYQDLIRFQKL